jgi:hypothetical protein
MVNLVNLLAGGLRPRSLLNVAPCHFARCIHHAGLAIRFKHLQITAYKRFNA